MDSNDSTAVAAGMGIAMVFMFVFFLVIHLFVGYCFKKIAEKTGNHDVAKLWWIPVVNYVLVSRAANKPTAWMIIAMIPVVSIIVWNEVAKNLGHDSIWGVIAGVFSIVGIPYLAFANAPNDQSSMATA